MPCDRGCLHSNWRHFVHWSSVTLLFNLKYFPQNYMSIISTITDKPGLRRRLLHKKTPIYLFIYLFSDFVQSTRYIKQKDTSPLQGFSTWLI